MISVTEAKNIIAANLPDLPVAVLPLQDAAHMVLAEDVFSTTDVPAFQQSSMDGYAFAFADWQMRKKLTIEGEVEAGSKTLLSLGAGQAIRIFTGAPLPSGADTVVMQEKVTVKDDELLMQDENLLPGGNTRAKGAAIKVGQLALAKNTLLSPAAIGFLAGIGVSKVSVFARPSVSIIVTGKELQQPGIALQHGEVYESNSFALKAALMQLHINNIKVYSADDDLEILTQVLAEALNNSDMVLLTGGVSVGDYDFVLRAAEACGIEKLFHKIKQKPGKPLYFGRKENKIVFGLPGNPSSVLTCFYEYVLTAFKTSLPVLKIPLAKACRKPAGLTQFLKAFYNGTTVMPLDAQESYRMSSFAMANCLVQLDEETTECAEGEIVQVHLLPI